MKAKHHLILYTFLGLAVVIAVFLAMDSGLQAQRSAQALEDSYAQRLLEAQEHLRLIALRLDKLPAAGGVRTQVELLSAVSRQADGVVSDLTALPLSHIAMSDTIRFCNQVSEYTLALALLSSSGQPLSSAAMEDLARMQNHCSLLLGQLVTARSEMAAHSLRMLSDSSAFYQPAQLALRPIEQVAHPETGMDYPALVYDGAYSDEKALREPRALGTQMITQERAVELARAFIGEERVASAEAGVPSGGPMPCFGVKVTLRDGLVLNADLTRQGGQVLWIMPEQADFAPALTIAECEAAGRAFLQSRGYGDMEACGDELYDGMAVVDYAAVQQGVLLYPDLIKLQIRMDTGEVVGMESSRYLMNHTAGRPLVPSLSAQEAQETLSPRLHITRTRLCVLPWHGDEKLCWEFAAALDENDYRVYVDAHTGEERDVVLDAKKRGQSPSFCA